MPINITMKKYNVHFFDQTPTAANIQISFNESILNVSYLLAT